MLTQYSQYCPILSNPNISELVEECSLCFLKPQPSATLLKSAFLMASFPSNPQISEEIFRYLGWHTLLNSLYDLSGSQPNSRYQLLQQKLQKVRLYFGCKNRTSPPWVWIIRGYCENRENRVEFSSSFRVPLDLRSREFHRNSLRKLSSSSKILDFYLFKGSIFLPLFPYVPLYDYWCRVLIHILLVDSKNVDHGRIRLLARRLRTYLWRILHEWRWRGHFHPNRQLLFLERGRFFGIGDLHG